MIKEDVDEEIKREKILKFLKEKIKKIIVWKL